MSRKTIFLYKKDCFQHRMMVLGLFDINYSLRVTLSDTFMGKTMAFYPEHPKKDQNLQFLPLGRRRASPSFLYGSHLSQPSTWRSKDCK